MQGRPIQMQVFEFASSNNSAHGSARFLPSCFHYLYIVIHSSPLPHSRITSERPCVRSASWLIEALGSKGTTDLGVTWSLVLQNLEGEGRYDGVSMGGQTAGCEPCSNLQRMSPLARSPRQLQLTYPSRDLTVDVKYVSSFADQEFGIPES
jgi:hypothetical protein